MTLTGALLMVISVGSVMMLTVYCLARVLTLPRRDMIEHLKAPLDIDTGDTRDADG